MKNLKPLALSASLLAAVFMMTGCGGSDTTAATEAPKATEAPVVTEAPAASAWKVTFSMGCEELADVVTEVENENAAEPPATPERAGYAFRGWYADAGCTSEADFEVAILSDTVYYAGWEKTAASVTFDPNWEGAEKTVTEVNVGEAVSTPVSPTRDGYLFTAWFTTPDGSEAYDFSAAVTGDLTLYAGWEQDSGNNFTVTWMWNFEDKGVFDTVKVKKLSYAAAPEISMDGWYLEGWYTDEACTERFDAVSTRVKSDLTLYANWLKVFTFEAEYTDLTGLEGMGYSGNASGTKMIEDGTSRAASNDHYVGWLYNEGLCLTFHVTSDAATDSAKLALSLSAEFYDITLTNENYTVAVNGEAVAYQDIAFTGTAEAELPFVTYVLQPTVSLQEGDNVITLTVTNTEKKTGTIYATAPMVDCLYVYSHTNVAWSDGYPMTGNVK